jgi:hypothetical protein
MRAGEEKRKLLLDNSRSLTPSRAGLLAIFRAMTEPDRRLLLSTAEEMITTEAARGSGTA